MSPPSRSRPAACVVASVTGTEATRTTAIVIAPARRSRDRGAAAMASASATSPIAARMSAGLARDQPHPLRSERVLQAASSAGRGRPARTAGSTTAAGGGRLRVGAGSSGRRSHPDAGRPRGAGRAGRRRRRRSRAEGSDRTGSGSPRSRCGPGGDRPTSRSRRRHWTGSHRRYRPARVRPRRAPRAPVVSRAARIRVHRPRSRHARAPARTANASGIGISSWIWIRAHSPSNPPDTSDQPSQRGAASVARRKAMAAKGRIPNTRSRG